MLSKQKNRNRLSMNLKKIFQALSFTGALLLSQSSFSFDASEPKTTLLPTSKIFTIERGFDTNDATEVAIQGYLPNTCYSLGKGTAQIDEENKKIFVGVEGYIRHNQICLQVMTPYLEVIHLGPLVEGDYEVFSMTNLDISGKLHIEASPSENVDEHLYAPVDTVYINSVPSFHGTHHEQILTLKGTYPFMVKGCMRIHEVKTYMNSNDVLVVLPIAKIYDDEKAVECRANDVDRYNRFHVNHITTTPIREKGLVHVRTLAGKALNQFVDLSNK